MQTDPLDRTPPHDQAAEKAVVGSLLIDPRRLDEVGTLKPADFHNAACGRLYSHLQAAADANEAIDISLLIDRLKKAGELEAVGGHAFIAEVLDSVAVSAHAAHYARIVLGYSCRRQIIRAATAILTHAWDAGMDPDEVLATAEQALAEIKTGAYNTDPVTMWDATIAAMNEIDAIIRRKRLPGVMIGLPQFDEEVGGFFRGELVILGARPGQGKTSLALQMAAHCAARGRRVYFATLEMGASELALKQLATESGVSSQRIRSGRITEDDRSALSDAAGRVAVKNLLLHDWPEIRPFDIQRAARRFDAEIVFVDYLQIVSPPDAKKKRYEQVGDISRQLKMIARQMDVPVVTCAQIGRQAENRTETRPKLSDLRESGNIENDCDMALLLWRPEGGIHGKKGTPHDGEEWDADLEVAKNRKGMRKRFRLVWHGDETRFSCYGCFTPQDPGGADWDADNSLNHLGGFS